MSEPVKRLPAKSQFEALIREGRRSKLEAKSKSEKALKAFTDARMNAGLNGNFNLPAFDIAMKIAMKAENNEIAARDQAEALLVYLPWVIDEIRSAGHTGDLDRMSRAAEAAAPTPEQPQSNGAEKLAGLKPLDPPTNTPKRRGRKPLPRDEAGNIIRPDKDSVAALADKYIAAPGEEPVEVDAAGHEQKIGDALTDVARVAAEPPRLSMAEAEQAMRNGNTAPKTTNGNGQHEPPRAAPLDDGDDNADLRPRFNQPADAGEIPAHLDRRPKATAEPEAEGNYRILN